MTQTTLLLVFVGAALIFWVLYRIFRPYRCECGYWTPFYGQFRSHLKARHGPK